MEFLSMLARKEWEGEGRERSEYLSLERYVEYSGIVICGQLVS